MNSWESVKLALSGLNANKMRSFLTMLGVIIGVGAVIAMVSLGEGAKVQVSEQINTLGGDLLIVKPGRFGSVGGAAGTVGSAKSLTYEHAIAISERAGSAKAVVPELSGSATVSYGNSAVKTTVIGTTPDFAVVRNAPMADGRFLTEEDLDRKKRVAVLGASVAEDLFGTTDPVGQSIRIDRRSFEVVGVLKAKGEGMLSYDDNILVPLTTAEKRLFGTPYLRTIYVQAASPEVLSQTEAEVNSILMDEFGDPNAFYVRNLGEVLSTMEETTKTFTFLLGGIAAVSLLVGGIGIMNIMLVSVTERTREIGIRKAIGASGRDIMGQFIIEAVVLSGIGGILGIGFGYASGKILARLGGWAMYMSPVLVIVALVFSAGVGLVFGIWPAARAAKLDPIESLRYE